MSSPPSPHAQVVVDLGAIRHNVTRLREIVSEGSQTPQLMVVVKADAYGHGMVPVARAARAAGAEWIGVATGAEALALREAGDTGRVLCWLAAPGADFAPLVSADVDVAAYSVAQLSEVVAAARAHRPGGAGAAEVRHRAVPRRRPALRVAGPRGRRCLASHRTKATIAVTGVWSHLACSDEPDHPANAVAGGRVRGGAGAGRRRRARARGPSPGQLGRRDPAAGDPL